MNVRCKEAVRVTVDKALNFRKCTFIHKKPPEVLPISLWQLFQFHLPAHYFVFIPSKTSSVSFLSLIPAPWCSPAFPPCMQMVTASQSWREQNAFHPDSLSLSPFCQDFEIIAVCHSFHSRKQSFMNMYHAALFMFQWLARFYLLPGFSGV